MPISLLSQCSPVLGSLRLRPMGLGPLHNIMGSKTAKKAGLALLLGSLLVREVIRRVRRKRIREKMKKKREQVRASKEALEQRLLVDGVLVTPAREEILALQITALLERLRSGALDVEEVLAAYQAKTLAVDKDINAVCEMITEASDWASHLSTLPRDKRGPLYGLPVSIKECFFVAGYDTTAGLAQYIDDPSSKDCDIVASLKNLGAIPFCLTNVPQTMISYACSNPVFGNTANPHCLDRSPGGSSGGEAALIAAGGSILGLGSDVAGSLRIPATFSGVCGMKPSSSRIYEGGRRGGVGAGSGYIKNGFYAVNGFMAPSVAGIEVGMRALLTSPEVMTATDYRVAPVPWREDIFTPGRKLRIGFYTDDGMFPCTPGMVRAVEDTVSLLRGDGHQVIPWTPPDLKQIHEVFCHFLLADKGFHFLRTMKNEEIDKAIEVNAMNYKTPVKLKRIMSFFFQLFSKKLAFLWSAGKEKSQELWVLNAAKDKLIYQLTQAWEASNIDILLCPAFPIPAISPSLCSRLLPAASYTCVYNLVGCPAGIVPVSKESESDQAALSSYPVSTDLLHRVAKNATAGALGCPLGVQVVGRHYKDELVIHAMGEVERLSRAAAV